MHQERIFIDTGAWVALADEDDAHHKNAISIFPSLLNTSEKLITSNLVIAESYILILKCLGHDAAISFLEKLNTSPRIIRTYSTADLEREAEKILKKYADQDFSYTDAVSFAIMKRHNITKTFSYDRHFQTMGFLKVS